MVSLQRPVVRQADWLLTVLSVFLMPHDNNHTSHAEIANESLRSGVPIWLGSELFRPCTEHELPIQDNLRISTWKFV